MKLTFAYSPCPNDTFMFEPIVNQRIDLRGLEFDIILDEVEQLNLAAQEHKYNISKISFNAFTKLTDSYQLLTSGSALGRNCGPLIIAKETFNLEDLKDKTIAIPGVNTTANLLLDIAVPNIRHKKTIVFSEIENAVLSGEVDAGLIIHENRFTYESKGLKKIIDLGAFWESQTQTPIPLGGIAIQRELDDEIKQKVNAILFDSIKYAFEHPKSGIEYISCHAQEMDTEVMYKHINLYVNEYSQDLGREGKASVVHLFDKLVEMNRLDVRPNNIFV